MKKTFLTIVFALSILATYAQDSTSLVKVYPNEFGVDMTGFIRQFFNFSSSSGTYQPFYYLTYRRHFKRSNLRFAIGGRFESGEVDPINPDDTNTYEDNYASINTRIGWEFFNELSKRWQVFYGLDFRISAYKNKNDAQYFSGAYAFGRETKTQIYGIAPVLGFRFRMTDRLSISTEANFSINWSKRDNKRYFTPVTDLAQPRPEEVDPTNKRIYSSFSQPISLFLTFDI